MNSITKKSLSIGIAVGTLAMLMLPLTALAKSQKPLDPKDPTGNEIDVNLKCEVNLPFIGVKVTNNSGYTIPANTVIHWKAYNYAEQFTGQIQGPLAKGASKTSYVPNSKYDLKCVADASFYKK